MRTEKFFRGSQKGLNFMNCGSFYTPCEETAKDYAYNNDETVYSFDLNVKLFDTTPYMSICDFDLGLSEIFEILTDNNISIDEVFNQNDGFRIDCGHTWLVILFGRLEVNTNILTKLSFEEMIIEDEINEIEK